MSLSRKDFLKLSGGFAAATLISPVIPECSPGRLKTYGIQLYSLRDEIEKDVRGILRQLSSFGYKQVESFERAKGIYWGMTPMDFKNFLDDMGMKIVGSHCDINHDFERKASEAGSIGMPYIGSSSYGRLKSVDDYKKLAERFNSLGNICKKAGTKFYFHGEDHEYKLLDGQSPIEIMLQYSDPLLVDYEIDFYWVILGGDDPQRLLTKYPNRFRLCHIKDRVKGTTKREDTCDLGTGSIDLPALVKSARKNGMQFFIAEQEHSISTPLQSAEANARYMETLRV